MHPLIFYEIALIVVIQHLPTISAARPRTSVPCPNDFLRIHNKCYYFSNDFETWEGANWKCEDRNSTLVVINSRNQNNALREFLKKGYTDEKAPLSSRVQTDVPRWMGGQYDWKSAQWKWIYNGKTIRYNQYHNNLDGKKLAWHCLVIDSNSNYRWDAHSCFDKNYYICQTRSLNREQQQPANITANSRGNATARNNDNIKMNSTEQHDIQPGFYVVDAGTDRGSTRRKKPKRKFICPKDQILVGKKCYFLSRDKENWNNAFYKCQDMKSELVILKNTKQDKKLRNKIGKFQLSSEKRWIGGYFDWKKGVWKWAATGAVLPVQPYAAVDLQWACVLWDPYRMDSWTSESCLTPMYYMCQTMATPAERKQHSKKGQKPHSKAESHRTL